MKHFIESQQFGRADLEDFFSRTGEIKKLFIDPAARQQLKSLLPGKHMHILFCEPSTRTRFCFGDAGIRLGMTASQTENGEEFSSLVKNGSFEDEIRSLCSFKPDVIVIRHKEEGASKRAAAVIDRYNYETSVINAGDGTGQHPTQSLLDLYTIMSCKKSADNLHVTVGGDLANGRTARSLVYLLTKFENVTFSFVSPHNLRMKSDILAHLQEHGVRFEETTRFHASLERADVVYWTRVQEERGGVNSDLDLTIGPEEMKLMKEDAILLHPLPRVGEISQLVDDDPRAKYFEQVENGLYVRMQLLRMLLQGK